MIYVLIERRVAAGLEKNYKQIIPQLMSRVYEAPGFISGESLKNLSKANHKVVLCVWRSLHQWKMWEKSESRKEMQSAIRPMLDEEEKITVLQTYR